MTEPATPELGWGGGMRLAAHVQLVPGEIPLCAWDAMFVQSWWRGEGGVLYLTSDRLVWIRWRGSVPWVAKLVSISLQDVARVEARRGFWAYFLGLFAAPFRDSVVVKLKGSKRYVFKSASFGPGARSIVTEINSILRERGLLRD